jgi:hypothetical protein
MCFRVWEEGFKDGKEMVEKGIIIVWEKKTCIINLSMLVFIAFSSYPTTSKK